MTLYLFKQGYAYVAGFHKPWIAPESAIRSGVEEKGFQVLYAAACEEGVSRLPFGVPGRCGDEWDWVAIVQRTAPTQSIDVPGEVKWIQEVPKPQPVIPGQPPAPVEPPATWTNPSPPSTQPTTAGAANGAPKINMTLVALVGGGLAGLLVVKWLTRR